MTRSPAVENERRRLENLKLLNESVQKCLTRTFLYGYMPGQV